VTAVRLENLTKVFERAGKVVDAVNLQVADGEFFTLLGPSGCGKTTILRMIAGFEEPTAGRVWLGARDVTHDPPNRRNIGLVFQNYALFPHLSVARNVAFGLEVRKQRPAEIADRVRKALADVQLQKMDNARVSSRSLASRLDNGSSSSSKRGWITRARASATRCC
jgi:iron(III) transport system ATP-binding protein